MNKFYPLMVIFILIGCRFHTDPLDVPFLNGVVVDSFGNPVKDALIEIEYKMVPNTIGKGTVEYEDAPISKTIRFQIPYATEVVLWISRYQNQDTVRILVDDYLLAGAYSIIWDGQNRDGLEVINQVYQYHLEFNETRITDKLLISRSYEGIEDTDRLEFYSKTDKSGTFNIIGKDLACNYNLDFYLTDEIGKPVGSLRLDRNIKIWALHENLGKTYEENVYIDENKSVYVTLIF